MEMIFSIWTVVVMMIFFGVVAWAWSSKRKEEFEAASRLALDLDDVTGDESERNDG